MTYKGFKIIGCNDDSSYFFVATHPCHQSIYGDSIDKIKLAIEDFINDSSH